MKSRTAQLFQPLKHQDLLSLAQVSADEMHMLFSTAAALKQRPLAFRHALEGKTIVLLFEKESLRTLATFEIGMARLGGQALYFDHRANRIGEREPIRDYAKNLERWTNAIVARTYEHSTIEELARHATVPVINALSNLSHPCQALADYFTLLERFGSLDGLRVAYVGDGNNVCHSLLLGAAILGVHFTCISPKNYQPLPDYVSLAQRMAQQSGAHITTTEELNAVANHHAVYTDTWISMGSEAQTQERLAAFATYQVTAEMMTLAGQDAVFMHCLPAHRGQEVAAEVIDSPQSIVYDQAENRMHVQNALLVHLLEGVQPNVPIRREKKHAAGLSATHASSAYADALT
jgi:ornithine carbamoyltransferase